MEQTDKINLGSYYTPTTIVDIAWQMLNPPIDKQATILDTTCGYGNFLRHYGQAETIGCDIDDTALDTAREINLDTILIKTNSLKNVSRQKFCITEQEKLIIIGNPPYNDHTSLIRRNIKRDTEEIDADLKTRDIGISFMRSYNKLKADTICILHPLSYLIKRTNFKSLKGFASNYKLNDAIIISSQEFSESAHLTPFPIIVAIYHRSPIGMTYKDIKSFPFKINTGGFFQLTDFKYITSYVDKYPQKKKPADPDPLYFWTLRDINALSRNKTFVEEHSTNTITIDKAKLEYYIYIDVFKRNLHRIPFYLRNCDIPIDNKLFKDLLPSFVYDSIQHHPHLKDHFQIKLPDPYISESSIDMYFRQLLRTHHTIMPSA